MTAGSGLFSTSKAKLAHQTRSGLGAEVEDLRKDIQAELSVAPALCIEEFTNPVGTAAPGAAVLRAATATVASPVTLGPADLLDAGEAMLAAWPRQLTFTTAGGTPADAPANVVITGKNQYGATIQETLNLAQTAATATSVNYYSEITSLAFPAADGTAATVSIGIAAAVIKAATATVTTAVTLGPGDLIQNDLARHPRQLVFTTAGGTPAHAPANAVITGKDINGLPLEETLALAQTGTTATTVNAFARIDSIAYPAGDGTGATIAITFAAPIGLKRRIKARTGFLRIWNEAVNGANATNGTVTAHSTIGPYGAYTPNTAANDAGDYALTYEYDATVNYRA